MSRPPLARRSPLPLVKCPDEGVRFFVSQQICRLVQLERGLGQVVLCHIPPPFFHESVKRYSFFEQAPLQRPAADPQLDGNVLQARFLPCQESLENSLR